MVIRSDRRLRHEPERYRHALPAAKAASSGLGRNSHGGVFPDDDVVAGHRSPIPGLNSVRVFTLRRDYAYTRSGLSTGKYGRWVGWDCQPLGWVKRPSSRSDAALALIWAC